MMAIDAVEFGFGHIRRRGRCGGRPDNRCAVQRLIGQRFGLAFHRRGLRGIETKRGFQVGEEAALGIALGAVGIAHADRHFVRELAVTGVVERNGGASGGDTLEQYVLIQTREIGGTRLVGERFGQPANPFAFALVLAAVGKGCQQGDRQDGFLLFRIHGHSPVCATTSPGRSPAG